MTTAALPSMARAFGIAPAHAVLAMSAYQAALVMALLPGAAIGERFGYRRVFLAGVAIFMLASLASALAPSFPILLVSRFVQGLGGAAILALGVALMRFTVSDARLGQAIGWNAVTVALSAAAAPALAGLLLSCSSWHWIYLASLPLGATVLFFGHALPCIARRLDRLKPARFGLNAAGFGLLVAGASSIARGGLVPAAFMLAGAICIAVLVRLDRGADRPLIPTDLLAIARFRASSAASLVLFTGQSAALIALPFHLQGAYGLSPGMAGALLMAWPLSVAVTTTAARRWIITSPTPVACAVGALVLSAGLIGLALIWVRTGLVPLALATCLCGAGFGVFQVANNRSMFLAAPPQRSGAAGALQGMARVSGQTAGAILAGLLLATFLPSAAGRTVFAAGAALCVCAGLLSHFGHRSRNK